MMEFNSEYVFHIRARCVILQQTFKNDDMSVWAMEVLLSYLCFAFIGYNQNNNSKIQ